MTTARPITLVEPQLAQLVSGKLTRLRRPKGLLAGVVPGDHLWVREPFHLQHQFDRFAPTVAETLGARPYFVADFFPGELEKLDLGNRRFARNLLKVWHRQHLRVTAIELRPLQEIADEEIHAEGFSSRQAYAAAWNKHATLNVFDCEWQYNPGVLVIDFDRIAAPVPAPGAPA